eukprot:scaffold111719_cov63-Phaeocystis_antarctica.AAC.4
MKAPQIAAPTGKAAIHAGQRAEGGASPRKEGLFTRAAPVPSRSICTGQARGMASPRKRRADSTKKSGDVAITRTTTSPSGMHDCSAAQKKRMKEQ